METRIPDRLKALIIGNSWAACAASPTRAACAKVDSAPISMISAPCADKTSPRRIALSAFRHTLSRYQESAERLITPMIAEQELKVKCLPPIENSLTRALSAA